MPGAHYLLTPGIVCHYKNKELRGLFAVFHSLYKPSERIFVNEKKKKMQRWRAYAIFVFLINRHEGDCNRKRSRKQP